VGSLTPSSTVQIIEADGERLEAKAYAALALGFIGIGTADHKIFRLLLNQLDTREIDPRHPSLKLFYLAIGLIYFGEFATCQCVVWIVVIRFRDIQGQGTVWMARSRTSAKR
jgi:hypothetical protein